MSGHSKWNNIKNRKGAQDTQRASQFNQISKQIRIAVKLGKSGDPKFNPSLRLAMDKARLANMPNEKVQRAVDSGLGKGKNGAIQESIYECFGPGGVAILVIAHTDNPHRTSAEIKFILSRNGGAMAGPGSAAYLFKRQNDEYVPTMPLEVGDAELEALANLQSELEANEDVEDVYLNLAFLTDDEASETS